MRNGAIMDEKGNYRYSLWRSWDEGKPRVTFIMLNPGTADETYDDLTITRCINFAKRWGFGTMKVVNLFAYRAADFEELMEVNNPVGEKNDEYILEAVKRADKVVLAWGTQGTYGNRDMEVLQLLTEFDLFAIDLSKRGHPIHPLYLNTYLDLMKLV